MKNSESSLPEKQTNQNKSKKPIWIYFGFFFFLIVFATNILAIFEPFGQDEGIFLTIAKGFYQGFLPYHDFFDHKPPGLYFFLALVAWLQDPLKIRIFYLVFNIITAFFVFLACNNLKRNAGYNGAIIFLASIPFFQGNRIAAEPLLALLITISIYLVVIKSEKNYLFLPLILFLLPLIKQSGIINSILIFTFFLTNKSATVKQKRITYLIVSSLTILFISWLAFEGILKEFVNQAILLNFTSYPRESLPPVLRSIANLIFHTFPIWILSFVAICFSLKEISPELRRFLLANLLLPMPFFFIRHYEHYWLQILPILAIFASLVISSISKNFLATALVTMILFINFWGNFKLYYWLYLNKYKPWQDEYNQALTFIKNSSANFVLTENQFTIFYFSTKKIPLTKFLYITEVNDQKNIAQEKTIEELEQIPRTIAVWPENKDFAYAKKLQAYLEDNYIESNQFNNLQMKVLLIANNE